MNVSLKCRCGALRGTVEDVPRSGWARVVCLCDDCQAYAHYLGRASDVLDANGGTDIYPVAPASLKITRGLEHLKCLRLTGKGMLRWYAGCCKTPIANSAPYAQVPHNGVVHVIMDHAADGTTRDAALGPIRYRIFGKFGIGKLPPGTLDKASLPVVLGTIGFLLGGFLRRRYQPSPFFDPKTGQPSVTPYVLTTPEREALRPLCGPKP